MIIICGDENKKLGEATALNETFTVVACVESYTPYNIKVSGMYVKTYC